MLEAVFGDVEPEVAEIEHKILEAILDFAHDESVPEPEFKHVLSALVRTLSFVIALARPDARETFARYVRELVPGMLANANRLAATWQRTTD